MDTLLFLPVTIEVARFSDGQEAVAHAFERRTYALSRSQGGRLVAQPESDLGTSQSRSAANFLATLYIVPVDHSCEMYLIGAQDSVQLNGRRPFVVANIQPGDLIAAHGATWMVVTLWRPEPMEAPSESADKCCPVCGGPLALAPVVRHTCGRFYHLERPDTPENTDVLNCYLAAGACSGCDLPLGLEPLVLPAHAQEMIVDPDAYELPV